MYILWCRNRNSGLILNINIYFYQNEVKAIIIRLFVEE